MRRNHLEDFLDALGVELRRTVVVVDAVLLLLHVGNLRVAEAGDVLALLDGLHLFLEDGVEVFDVVDVASVAP